MSLSLLEQSLRIYPILRGILSRLEPYDFSNLLLAGVEMPITSASANKLFIRRICEMCKHTNERKRVYPCIGCYSEPCDIDLHGNIENRWLRKLTVVEPHSMEICKACVPSTPWRPTADWLTSEKWALLGKGIPMYFYMCKQHCLENFNPSMALPLTQCGCPALFEEGYPADGQGRVRCRACFEKTRMTVHIKTVCFMEALRYRQTTTTTTTSADTSSSSGTKTSLMHTCCMLDCKEKIWDDRHNSAFSVFCPACVTVFKPEALFNKSLKDRIRWVWLLLANDQTWHL